MIFSQKTVQIHNRFNCSLVKRLRKWLLRNSYLSEKLPT